MPHQLFKFIAYMDKHNPSITCLFREPVLLIACIKIFSMLLYPSSGSFYSSCAAGCCCALGYGSCRRDVPALVCPLLWGVNLEAPSYSSHLGLFSLKEVPVQSIYVNSVHSGIHLAVVISCYFWLANLLPL